MTFKTIVNAVFEISEDVIYFVVGLLLIITALFMIVNIIINMLPVHQPDSQIMWTVEIIDKIMLLLMIIEILYTVRVSFKEHVLCSIPFLIVGLIAAIRRILIISVESAYLPEKFNNHMIEVSILGGLIVIFVGAIIFLRKQKIAKR